MKTWIGEPPKECDLCSYPLVALFVDGRTREGPWGFMCMPCFERFGCGLGLGRGQLYQYDKGTDKWIKIAG